MISRTFLMGLAGRRLTAPMSRALSTLSDADSYASLDESCVGQELLLQEPYYQYKSRPSKANQYQQQYRSRFPAPLNAKGSIGRALNPVDLVKEAEDDLLGTETGGAKGPHLLTLSRFSKILGPLRPGELTVFTGPTGCGKTTVLSQMSLEYACQGVRTLWGSFEIKNARLARVMLQQIADSPFSVDPATGTWTTAASQELQRARGIFSNMPLLFMPFHGPTTTDEIIEVIRNAAALPENGEQPLRHVILDNLQFLLSCPGPGTALDRWEQSDRIVSALRALATETGLNVTLVIHPRKEMDDTWLGLASISGTAKATQEADNVVIIQKIQDRRYLEVKKNRFSGDLGRVRIGFDPASRKVFEIDDKQEEPPRPELHEQPHKLHR